ncbi:hypothetical protein AVEN_195184-1 [Araneus ventricosus]|uniref:Uncharacterized protein n=1 Tax=Araneus ventricosus TaxID=182803 RepID=A0A4Y2JD03_ARAVE|nr:hypothetical protein AVEN_195184-1 [Araneus ventricosus]
MKDVSQWAIAADASCELNDLRRARKPFEEIIFTANLGERANPLRTLNHRLSFANEQGEVECCLVADLTLLVRRRFNGERTNNTRILPNINCVSLCVCRKIGKIHFAASGTQ